VLSALFLSFIRCPRFRSTWAKTIARLIWRRLGEFGADYEAEKRANQIVFENRPVRVRYVSRAEAEKLGLRKLPPAERDELRLIEVADFDLSACGGTHVGSSGQIGSICCGKARRCGRERAWNLSAAGARFAWRGAITVRSARRPRFSRRNSGMCRSRFARVSKRASCCASKKTMRWMNSPKLMALAALHSQPETNGRKIVVRAFSDRDINFAKLFAQKVTRAGTPAIALVASTVDPPGLVLRKRAQTSGGSGRHGRVAQASVVVGRRARRR
jgi:alanyl-tRNA synthetase